MLLFSRDIKKRSSGCRLSLFQLVHGLEVFLVSHKFSFFFAPFREGRKFIQGKFYYTPSHYRCRLSLFCHRSPSSFISISFSSFSDDDERAHDDDNR